MTELERLKEELNDLIQNNIKAWETYGSELCAGEMTAKERKLEEKIKELENVPVD